MPRRFKVFLADAAACRDLLIKNSVNLIITSQAPSRGQQVSFYTIPCVIFLCVAGFWIAVLVVIIRLARWLKTARIESTKTRLELASARLSEEASLIRKKLDGDS